MSQLTLLSTINLCSSKCVSISQIIRSEINQQSTDDIVDLGVSVVNQPIPLPLDGNTFASGRNGLSLSDSEVLVVLFMLEECQPWLQGSGGLVANVQT